MPGFISQSNNSVEEKSEEGLINMLRPELNFICSNPVRASILHLMVKARDLNHTMRVEDISHKIGKRHSVVIHHLERLSDWNLIKVIKNSRYGERERRTIWGLNLNCPRLIQEVYTRILKFFYTHDELEKMCSVNRNTRIDTLA